MVLIPTGNGVAEIVLMHLEKRKTCTAYSAERWVEYLFSYSFPSCSPRVTDVAFNMDQSYGYQVGKGRVG